MAVGVTGEDMRYAIVVLLARGRLGARIAGARA
jgi:hypothetical protein